MAGDEPEAPCFRSHGERCVVKMTESAWGGGCGSEGWARFSSVGRQLVQCGASKPCCGAGVGALGGTTSLGPCLLGIMAGDTGAQAAGHTKWSACTQKWGARSTCGTIGKARRELD